jgi:hypothetical protein
MLRIESSVAAAATSLCVTLLLLNPIIAAGAECTEFKIDGTKSAAIETPAASATGQVPGSCRLRQRSGYWLPDPRCTPGSKNPDLTEEVLRNPAFRTGCVRDSATSETDKSAMYARYGVARPPDNRGVKQICELDHLVSLELGGADTLDNIWPQCGPSKVVLRERYFKVKDEVENYLARRVREGSMRLIDAQRGIANDWTQFIKEAHASD